MTESNERPDRAEQASALLGDAVRAVVRQPALGDTFQTLFACTLHDCIMGWPRSVRADAVGSSVTSLDGWLRPGDVVIELARSPAEQPLELLLSLSSESAVQLVDALLGGRVGSGLAGQCGAPSEAECGVLAYAAARLLAAHGAAWIVRDVHAARGAGELSSLVGAHAGPAVVWPLALQTSAGSLNGALWLSRGLAERMSESEHRLEVCVQELVERAALAQLAVGDEWICEGLSMTLTSEGLNGHVQLALAGNAQRLSAQLRRNRVRTTSASTVPPSSLGPTSSSGTALQAVELVLTTRLVSLLELAELASGFELEVESGDNKPVSLRQAGRTLAHGTLIVWHGALGLRIESV